MTIDILLLQESSTLQREIGFESFILLQEALPVADQVAIQLPKTLVDEETTFTATAYFRDRDTKTASTPTNVYYRVDCLTTQTELTDWTIVATPGTQNAITLTSTHNKIQTNSNRREAKQITVQADRGLSTQITGKAVWRVVNQFGIGGNV